MAAELAAYYFLVSVQFVVGKAVGGSTEYNCFILRF